MKYPKIVYIQSEKDGGSEYLLAWDNVKDIEEDGKVAVYELKELKVKETVVKLNDQKS